MIGITQVIQTIKSRLPVITHSLTRPPALNMTHVCMSFIHVMYIDVCVYRHSWQSFIVVSPVSVSLIPLIFMTAHASMSMHDSTTNSLVDVINRMSNIILREPALTRLLFDHTLCM
jgi:hypothetical protein